MIFEEKLISNSGVNKKYSDYLAEEWIAIVNCLILKLDEFFGGKLIYREDDLKDVGNGFCIEFSTKPCLGPLNIYLKGTLGADILGDNEELRISAVFFIYSGESKLSAPNNKSYSELEYKKCEFGGNWESLGWKYDEYDEF